MGRMAEDEHETRTKARNLKMKAGDSRRILPMYKVYSQSTIHHFVCLNIK